MAPEEEPLGCSWGLHDPPVAPLIALIQVLRAFAVGSQSPFPLGAGWWKGHTRLGSLHLSWVLSLKPGEGSGQVYLHWDNHFPGPYWAQGDPDRTQK